MLHSPFEALFIAKPREWSCLSARLGVFYPVLVPVFVPIFLKRLAPIVRSKKAKGLFSFPLLNFLPATHILRALWRRDLCTFSSSFPLSSLFLCFLSHPCLSSRSGSQPPTLGAPLASSHSSVNSSALLQAHCCRYLADVDYCYTLRALATLLSLPARLEEPSRNCLAALRGRSHLRTFVAILGHLRSKLISYFVRLLASIAHLDRCNGRNDPILLDSFSTPASANICGSWPARLWPINHQWAGQPSSHAATATPAGGHSTKHQPDSNCSDLSFLVQQWHDVPGKRWWLGSPCCTGAKQAGVVRWWIGSKGYRRSAASDIRDNGACPER